MYLAEDLISASGAMIGNKNQMLTPPLIAAIRNYAMNNLLKDTIKVIVVVN